jgi:dTDP-4-dehydrorhamnose 3,5-epimerase
MKVNPAISQKDNKTIIEGLKIIQPEIFSDKRGYFFESFNHKKFQTALDKNVKFVQDNQSSSHQRVLRGLHYQINKPQGKLVRVTYGQVYDVAVDMRTQSPTFGHWYGISLSDQNHLQFWVPKGFAHGFVVLSDKAEFLYKTTDYWYPEYERCLLWNDLPINWPMDFPILSEKDQQGKKFVDCDYYTN